MQTIFELPLGMIFGSETTTSFDGIQKLLGFWQGRAFKKCLKMLKRLSIGHKWIEHVQILASGYVISSVDSLPENLSAETVVVVFYGHGRIDRFELINGKLRRYAKIGEWSSYLLPNEDRGETFRIGAILRLTKSNEGKNLKSLSDVLRIVTYVPIGA